jgi:hypothetical protein
LLEGVVDLGLVVRARLLQHVVEHAGASREPSRPLVAGVDGEGLVVVLIASLRTRVTTGFLALLAVENGPHRLLSGSEAVVDVE